MSRLKNLMSLWTNIGEVDLRPIRKSAEKPVLLVIAGGPGARRELLLEQLRRDPKKGEVRTNTEAFFTGLSLQEIPEQASLVIILLDASAGESIEAQNLARGLAGVRMDFLILVDTTHLTGSGQVYAGLGNWYGGKILYGSLEDTQFLHTRLAKAVLDQIPEDTLALARAFPLFRNEGAHRLINDTCVSNAAYSLSTGLAEAVPALNIPLNVTDMIVLTKAQAFLVYKLGLAFGFSTRWQDYVAEFGSIIGSGFLWRQIARQLVGLIPVWGIVPKVAVAYAGTYVVGNAVFQWYLTGREITRNQLSSLYKQAIARGQAFARELVRRKPNKRLKARQEKQLPAAEITACSNCGATQPAGASECKACGAPLK